MSEDDVKKAIAHSARAGATSRTWHDEDVRVKRLTRHICTVTCDGTTTEHDSVHAGFKAYDLPTGNHIKFRGKAKIDGVAIFKHEGKSYEFKTFLKEPERKNSGPHDLIAEALKVAEQQEVVTALDAPIDTEHDARVREPRAVVIRRGQREFRDALLEAYDDKCAITQCAATAVLEAAHIVPYGGEHTHRPDNGLLLRSDIHTLFDLGLLWVDPTIMCVDVAEQLIATEYEGLRGRALRFPQDPALRPHRDHLQYHADTAQLIRAARG